MKRILCGLAVGMVVLGGVFTADAGREIPEERARTLHLLTRTVTVEFTDTALKDVVEFVRTFTGADIDVMWLDDEHADGLDQEQTVSMDVTDVTALQLLERLLAKTSSEFDENNWQLSPSGVFGTSTPAASSPRPSTPIISVSWLMRCTNSVSKSATSPVNAKAGRPAAEKQRRL